MSNPTNPSNPGQNNGSPYQPNGDPALNNAGQQFPSQTGGPNPTQPLPPYNDEGATVIAPNGGANQQGTYQQQPGYTAQQPAYTQTQTNNVPPQGPGQPPAGATPPPKKKGIPWWLWLVLGLLILALLLGLLFANLFKPKPADTPTAVATTSQTTTQPTSPSTSPSTRTASSSPSASRSATASPSGTAAGAVTSMDSLKSKAEAAGINCANWKNTDSSGVQAQTCVQGAEQGSMMIYSPSTPLTDDFWGGFGSTYPNPGNYVVTDKSKFGVVLNSYDVAEQLVKSTGGKLYTIEKEGLKNA